MRPVTGRMVSTDEKDEILQVNAGEISQVKMVRFNDHRLALVRFHRLRW